MLHDRLGLGSNSRQAGHEFAHLVDERIFTKVHVERNILPEHRADFLFDHLLEGSFALVLDFERLLNVLDAGLYVFGRISMSRQTLQGVLVELFAEPSHTKIGRSAVEVSNLLAHRIDILAFVHDVEQPGHVKGVNLLHVQDFLFGQRPHHLARVDH